MKTFKQFTAKEEAPVNSTGNGVDMNTTGKKAKRSTFKKMFDRRSRYDLNKLFKRANDN